MQVCQSTQKYAKVRQTLESTLSKCEGGISNMRRKLYGLGPEDLTKDCWDAMQILMRGATLLSMGVVDLRA